MRNIASSATTDFYLLKYLTGLFKNDHSGIRQQFGELNSGKKTGGTSPYNGYFRIMHEN
jgi:hypothetical protein